jgi:tetratricopeptide (TPR) repeat protein
VVQVRYPALAELRAASRARVARHADTFLGVDQKFAGVVRFGEALKALPPEGEPDAEALTSGSPDYWRAVMEMAPEDPSIVFAAARLCVMKGLLARAEAWLLLGAIGMGKPFQAELAELKAGLRKVEAATGDDVQRGIALHDAGRYGDAKRVYDEVLAGHPQNAWALYEKSFAMLMADKDGSAAVREEMYRDIRRLDPFYWQAYQGTDKDVIGRQLPVVLSDIQPFASGKARSRAGLLQFAQGCEKIGLHDFAALAFWKLVLTGDDADAMMAHFFLNLKKLGHEAFVSESASDRVQGLMAGLAKPGPRSRPSSDGSSEALAAACANEIGILCGQAQGGPEALRRCLDENSSGLGGGCRRALEALRR